MDAKRANLPCFLGAMWLPRSGSAPAEFLDQVWMKLLIDHPSPFMLAHGGFQVLIERTWRSLHELGIEVEPVRWWDDKQRGDLIHFYGRVPTDYVRQAHKKGMPVIMSDLLSGTGARSRPALLAQTAMISFLRRALPGLFKVRFAWDSYQEADAILASTELEAKLARDVFRAPSDRVMVLSNGVEDIFFQTPPLPRGPWLLSTGRITEVKRILEVAQAAVAAQTPIWVVGRPMAPGDPYAERFFQLAKANPKWIRHESFISTEDLAKAYREARGFVLLSKWESLSIAALEASAGECPLLLSDVPWAHSAFGDHVSYCPVTSSLEKTAAVLRRFYAAAPQLKPPPKPMTWREVALRLRDLYERLLRKQ
jgi:glycosyltransferase involved in cell wall biosynthesis